MFKWRFDFWHWFGILSAFILAIWGSMTLFNYLEEKQGPNIEVFGKANDFVLPSINFNFNGFEKAQEIDTLKSLASAPNDAVALDLFSYMQKRYPTRIIELIGEYQTLWKFEITNNGSKGVGNSVLELPFSGKYLLNSEGKESSFGKFNQYIKIGNIYSDNKIVIYAWTNDPIKDYYEYYYGNSKLTYKGGAVNVEFPVETSGIYAWNIRNQNKPIIFLFAAIIVLFAIIMILFYNIGVNAAPNETVIEFGSRSQK